MVRILSPDTRRQERLEFGSSLNIRMALAKAERAFGSACNDTPLAFAVDLYNGTLVLEITVHSQIC